MDGHYTGTFISNLFNLFLAHCDFCRLLLTLTSSLNPDQDRRFVRSQFDADVNNKALIRLSLAVTFVIC